MSSSTLSPRASFRRLLRRARSGRGSAARQIVEHFGPALRGAVDRQIGSRLGRRVDADDILQSAFLSLFVRLRRDEFEISEGKDLWKLLLTLALNKVRSQARFHSAGLRDMDRECSPIRPDAPAEEMMAAVQQTDPAELAALADEVEAFLRRVPAWARPLVELRLQGLTSGEIARRTGRAERSVRRILARLEQQARDMVGEEDGGSEFSQSDQANHG